MVYEVIPIMAGKFGPVSNNVIYRNGDSSNGQMVPSYVFYIKSCSLNIIVDMSFSLADKCSRLTGLRCERVESLDRILKKHGVNPAAIDIVICTHLHWDHAGNGNLFPNAKIICQRDEIAWAIASPSWEPGYSKDFSDEFMEVLDRVETVDGNVVLQEGLELVKLGGHTPGTQAVVVNTVQGEVIIPGDLVMTYKNLKELVPIGLFHNLSECVDGIQWLRSQDALILPGHDWKTLHFGRE